MQLPLGPSPRHPGLPTRRQVWLLLGCLLGAAAPAHAEERWGYRVVPGDTLIGIARTLLKDPADWRALQRLNQVKRPRRMMPGTTLEIPLDWLRSQATVATVAAVVGPVSLERPAQPPATVEVGSTLRPLDRLQTGPDATVTLELADGSKVRLAADSRLTLNELLVLRGSGAAVSVLELHEGRAESQVRTLAPKPSFEIRTPVMNLGVRGTEFRGHADAARGQARAEVTAGHLVAAGATSAPREVAAGYGVLATAAGVQAPRPLPAAPDLARAPQRIERLPLDLPWPGTAPAPAWRAQVLDARGRVQLDRLVDRPRAQWADLPDGRYTLRVRALDDQGLEGLDSDKAFVLKARPEPPFTLAPRAGERLLEPSVTLRWTASTAAARYRLQVAATAGFEAVDIEREAIVEPTATVELAPGRWFWRLASVRADGDQGPWGDAQDFVRRDRPPAPGSPAPLLQDDRLTLRWSGRGEGDRYQIQLARDPAFEDLLLDRTVEQPGLELDAPPAGRYRLRVRTIDAEGVTGPWGAAAELEVPPPTPWWWLIAALLLLL